MSHYSREHLSDSTLLHQFATHVARDHADTAELLADLAEIDARKLYLPAGYPNMHLFCVEEFHLSEDAAFRRIRAARAARDFPVIFTFVADGRLSLTAIITLAPHLTAQTVDDLLAAATHKTKAAIALLLVQRFPQQEMAARIEALASPGAPPERNDLLGSGSPTSLALARVESGGRPSRVTPLAPDRHGVQFTMDQEACDLLREARELLGHQLPSGDIAEVFKGALRVYVRELRKRKFGATDKPCAKRRPTNSPRHIPDHVKRAVWERDRGQCTFVSASGHRCPARARLEFDHVEEVARGGRATVDGIRLRCRGHNQYTAERTFGVDFMKRKREQAREATARAQATAAQAPQDAGVTLAATAPAEPEPAATAGTSEAATAEDRDVTPWLQRLRFHAADVRRAAAYCEGLGDVSLEDRVRAALCYLRPRVASRHGGRLMPT